MNKTEFEGAVCETLQRAAAAVGDGELVVVSAEEVVLEEPEPQHTENIKPESKKKGDLKNGKLSKIAE